MAEILQKAQRWEITGNVFMEGANALLDVSEQLTLEEGAAVDFKEVGEVDTAAVSLMLEWKRRANAEKKSLAFVNMPNSLISLLNLYGLTEMFS